jgi:formylglycine-generating enzyme required for sulfatase activity/SAM-dependent methyltransferase
VAVPSFAAAALKVSNAEFLPFVAEGGYRERAWWVSPSGDDEGWRWRQWRNATHPSFWVASSHPDMAVFHGGLPGRPLQKDDAAPGDMHPGWRLRNIFNIIDMPWDWPVEVNALEAGAFMRWKAARENAQPGVRACAVTVSYRLPTEAEYHVMRGDPAPFAAATVGREPGAVAGGGLGEGKLGADGNGKAAEVRAAALAASAASASASASGASAPETDSAARLDVIMQEAAPGNTNWRFHSSTPVDFYGASSTGFSDTHGNVWEWVEDHFAPLPGFELHYMYDDFSAPCFDGWHTSIMGSSWASTGDLSSSFARYHFRRHFFQHLGFRYVRLETPAGALEPAEAFPGESTVTNLWEGLSSVSEDITDAFSPLGERVGFVPELLTPANAAAYSVSLGLLAAKAFEMHVLAPGAASGAADASGGAAVEAGLAKAAVLHLGCAVGATTFELSRAFGRVVGVDLREPAVRHARIFQHHGQLQFERVREGVLTDSALARVPAGVDRARVSFHVADACALSADVLAEASFSAASAAAGGGFDVVVVDDLLTKQRQPLDLVQRLATYVRRGGLLIITSSNDWSPVVTPRNSWLGGFKMNGEDVPTLAMLRHVLKRAFAPLESCDLSRLSRAHARGFRLDVLEASIWRRLE